MSTFVVGFHGEGRAEYEFLINLTVRILEELLPNDDILMFPFDKVSSRPSQIDTMIKIAEETYGWAFVVFHLDADAPSTTDAYNERFYPGYRRILELQVQGYDLNAQFVPVIPVRTTEAWMFVDFVAFQKVTKTPLTAEDLGFIQRPHQVGSIPDPKSAFSKAVNNSQPGRRKKLRPEDIYAALAGQIRLSELEKVPAYREFLQRLDEVLS